MRTKTLLLSTVALAAGIVASQAQSNVFSANVVGYATVVLQGQGAYTMVANPFDDGNGNQLTNLFANLPGGSQILTWNGTSFNFFNNIAGAWQANTNLPPGTGFFVKNGKVSGGPFPAITNVFVGSIVVPNGGSVSNALPVGYTMWGSPIPFTGDLSDNGTSTGDTNLNVGATLPAGSQILTWNQVNQSYDFSTKIGGVWNSTATNAPGQGFFLRNKNGPATNWVQSLTLQ